MFSRSAQTLKYCTEVVQSFRLPSISDTLQVRKLSSRRDRPHFIVVFSSSLSMASDCDQINVVTEVSYLHNKLRYATKPSKQFPELEAFEDLLKEKINYAIESSSSLNYI